MLKKFSEIEGGVVAAKGFSAAGMHCGVRKNKTKKDVAIIYSVCPCAAAGVFTRNKVKAAPIMVDLEHLKDGKAQAVIVNSGNANACSPNGEKNAKRMCEAAAKALGIKTEDVLVSSTGVIGEELNISAIEKGVPALCAALSDKNSASDDAAAAIMTTDLSKKQIAVETEIAGQIVHIGAIAKGSGMIHPNMGTLLSYVTTDCAISSEMLKKALSKSADISYNRVSVDGDTSTNDSLIILANGMAENPLIDKEGEAFDDFCAALDHINIYLAREIARDGEGATKLITCTVSGAKTQEDADILSKEVIRSSLVKAAMFGSDANWGRVLCAMGYSGADFDTDKVGVTFVSDMGSVEVCKNGRGLFFDEEAAKKILSRKEVVIDIKAGDGGFSSVAWGCDLTYDYVKINGDYRT